MRARKTESIKKTWETRIRETLESVNSYTERLIDFLNNQDDAFCQEYRKFNGLQMILFAQQNSFFSQGWNDLVEEKK